MPVKMKEDEHVYGPDEPVDSPDESVFCIISIWQQNTWIKITITYWECKPLGRRNFSWPLPDFPYSHAT